MKNKFTKTITLLLLILISAPIFGTGNSPWQRVDNNRVVYSGERLIFPTQYLSYSLDKEMLMDEFKEAPLSSVNSKNIKEVNINIPMPDGTLQSFRIFKSEVMHPDLASRYPGIITFSGQGITDPNATAVFDFTQFGFHAMILTAGNVTFIDPYSLNDSENYMVYYKRNFVTGKVYNCLNDDAGSLLNNNREFDPSPGIAKSVGTELKTYRLAMAATGEYSSFYGGTVAGALAGIVTSVNRVTGVYEREFSIRMQLIANTDTLIFTNATTDPYTNNNGGTMLSQNQTTVNNYIGGANYDIGHVFSTGGGGIAGLGVVCNFSNKARGVTGSPSPINDPFDIDYVAHEMGHQYGGNHTFNCEVGACSGNRAFTAAYEPGSGSTIMAYAGICGNNNLQSNSDDYFHTKSFDEITNYTTTGVGSNCPVTTPTGNTPPVILPALNYIVPYQTPFRLVGDAFDPDGDPITYCWEEYDLGPGGVWNNPTGNAPLFRSFDPVVSNTRLFPKLSNILNNNVTIGEFKPSYARTLNFKLTVRDNRLNGGGVTNTDTPIQVQVIDNGVPFEVTSQNTTGVIWQQGGIETVTWTTGGSELAPINTPFVNILLSTDGGQTFPMVIGLQVPNNGSYNVSVPFLLTTTARVMVEGDANIFFDINNKNFEIGTVGIGEINTNNGVTVLPNPASDVLEFILTPELFNSSSPITMEMTDMSGRLILDSVLKGERQTIQVGELARGMYMYTISQQNGIITTGKVILN